MELGPSPKPGQLPCRVSDLHYLYCWVCSEEEVRSPGGTPANQRPTSAASTSRFVHPCKCSLVAHEKVRERRGLSSPPVSLVVDPAMSAGQTGYGGGVPTVQDAVPA